MQWLRSWWSATPHPPGWKDGDELGAAYRQNLDDCGYSADEERVAHHLYHLMLYWRRLIGFMANAGTGSGMTEQGFLRTSLWTMVRVGTAMSDADVREFAARMGAADLWAAWAEYASDVAAIDVERADAVARARAAHARFARVDEIRRELALLHRYELDPPRRAPE
ncbi:MAG TPA: hypothetical protein VF625_10520 [Longimicrobium sp.]